ncbi:MAG: Hsp33 family molecular chaperone [Acidobacteria bacterium 13_1_20CM_3_53_8]|nr:MAG: Hsp33 family molecular chaperone [Acidobacteria bacterium 13_1_20CM_3_53_8]
MKAEEDSLVLATAAGGTVRCIATVTTDLVAEAARRHVTSPTVTAALGRTLTGTLLLASSLKELDRLTVQIVSDGLIGGITAEANARGEVRGYVRNPDAEVPLNEKGKFDVSAVVGNGMFYVIRESGYDVGLYREPYRGSVPITSGEIAEDFAYYLTMSEQIPSAVSLGVLLRAADEREAFVAAAGGLMIQIMPGADDKTIAAIESGVSHTPHTTQMISEGARPVDLLRTALGEVEFEILDEKRVSFACPCSYERAVSLISSVDRSEVESMLREDRGAVMTCHFCNESYRLNEEALENILKGEMVAKE